MRIRVLLLLIAIVAGLVFADRVMAHPPTGIVVDRSGNVYFSDLETVWKIDSQGSLTIFRSAVRGRHVHELSIDEEERIYGADISYEPATDRWISSL